VFRSKGKVAQVVALARSPKEGSMPQSLACAFFFFCESSQKQWISFEVQKLDYAYIDISPICWEARSGWLEVIWNF
jgi:hypothetical protein